jgi:hypothetical protein
MPLTLEREQDAGPQFAFRPPTRDEEMEQMREPPEDWSVREKCLFWARRFHEKFPQRECHVVDAESVAAFEQIVYLVASSKLTDYGEADYGVLAALENLCSLLIASTQRLDADLLSSYESWFYIGGVPVTALNTERREFLRLAETFAEPAQKLQVVRRERESIEKLTAEGVSDWQIAGIYGWKTENGAKDPERVRAYRRGEVTLTDEDKYLPMPKTKLSTVCLLSTCKLARRLRGQKRNL